MNIIKSFTSKSMLFGFLTAIPLFLGQACGQFGSMSGLSSLASTSNQLFSCTKGTTYQNGVCTTIATTTPGSVSLAGANQTTVPFGSGFQKFVYSAALPGAVNFTGLSGKVAIDSNSPFFSEALFTIGYSPTGVCPAQGASYMEYNDVFNAMPGAQILQQYIIKIVGGHLELPTNFTLSSPVPVQGCAFVIMDGDAGYKGSTDTMTSAITFNYTQGAQNGNNRLMDAAGGEYCYGLATGCTSSTTNQFRTIAKVGSSGHLSQLTGSISAAPLYIYKSTSLPAGAWSARSTYYVDKGCSVGTTGVQTGQDFYSQIPAGSTTLLDVTQNSGGTIVAQQSFAQAEDVDLDGSDCIVQLLQMSGAGPVDIEVQLKANIGEIALAATDTTEPIPALNPVSIDGETPVYQLSNGNGQNIYVINTEAVIPSGFGLVSADPAFMVFNTPVAGSVLLQRCVAGSYRFLSTDAGCEGSSVAPNGPLGYILTSQASGSTPLYRDRTDDYTSVVEQIDATAVYDVQEILGYVGTSAGPVTISSPTVGASEASILAAAPKAVVYRFLGASGAHGYSTDSSGAGLANFTLEGPAFQVYSSNVSGTVALNLCSQGSSRFMSVDASCEGSTVVRVLGYISAGQSSGLVPLYRFRNSNWQYTLETTDVGEGTGFSTMEVMGFVPSL